MNIRYILLVICTIIIAKSTANVDTYTCQCTFSDKEIKYIKITDGSDSCASKCFDLATIPCSPKTHTCECNGKKVKCLKKKQDSFKVIKESELKVRFTATDDSGHSGIVGTTTGYGDAKKEDELNVRFTATDDSGHSGIVGSSTGSGSGSGSGSSGCSKYTGLESNVRFTGIDSSGSSGSSCDTGSNTSSSSTTNDSSDSSGDNEYYCPCSASIVNVKILE